MTLPTPAELRALREHLTLGIAIDLDDCKTCQSIDNALRQFATLIESAERGVTDEVVGSIALQPRCRAAMAVDRYNEVRNGAQCPNRRAHHTLR